MNWISIKNPPKGIRKVIIYQKFSEGGVYWDNIDFGLYDNGKWFIRNDPSMMTQLKGEEIPTHWMPAPEPPRE